MTEPRTVELALEAAQAVSSLLRPDEFELSNGVRLRVMPVPPLAMREAALQSKPPDPPMVQIEDRGMQPNPMDPDYLKELEEYQARQLFRLSDVLLILGSEVTHVPENVYPPDSEDWVEMLQAAEVKVPNFINKHARRLTWMRLYATRTEADIAKIIAAIVSLSGVTEVDVQRAAAAFLRTQGR